MRKTEQDLRKMRLAGAMVGEILHELKEKVRPGVALKELDEYARRRIAEFNKDHNGKVASSFLNYQPEGATKAFPATICTSVNEVVVHGYPTNYTLKQGDIISIDFGIQYEQFHADAAVTVAVEPVDENTKLLIAVTEQALKKGIEAAVPGNHLGDIGWAIANHVKQMSKGRFSIVHGLTGHGIGKKLHEDPMVFNEGKQGEGMKLKKDMTFAIEPMVSVGSGQIKQLPDDSFTTSDKSQSAHFEHTIAITDDKPEILTGG